MADTGEATGRCLCGAVRVTAESGEGGLAGGGLAACHCGMCRRWTSSAFVEFVAKPGTVRVQGPVKVFRSSDWAERAFCETCGSALWYRLTAEGPEQGQYQLAAGLFENAAGLELKLEVFVDRKPDGYAFAGEQRTMTEAEIVAMYAPPEEGTAK